MLLKPASDFTLVSGGANNAITHSDVVRSTNGFAIGLAIISTLSIIHMCSYLILVVLHWVGLNQNPSSKYPQFHKGVFLIGVGLFFISKGIMLGWTLNALLDIKGIVFDLLTYWSLWLIVIIFNLKSIVSVNSLRSKANEILNKDSESTSNALEYPDVFIVMSIFREPTSALIETVDSLVESDYPKSKLRLILAFDENSEGLEYIMFLNRLNIFDAVFKYKYGETEYNGVRIIVGKFRHTGKQSSQRYGLEIIRRVFGSDPDISSDPILVFSDSDIIFDKHAILNGSMKLYNDRRIVGVLGSKSIKKCNNDILEIVETMECIEKEIFVLQAEKRYDCYYDMPGQLIMMRFAAFRDIELRYFGNLDQRTSIASYNRTRFADHLLLQNLIIENYGARGLYYSQSVKIQHRSAGSWANYIDEKRRHYLGLVATTVGILGSRKLFTEVKRVYYFNMWNLATKASQLTIFSLLLTCLFSNAYSSTQIILLLIPYLIRCLAFAFFSSKFGKPMLGIIYPLYSILLQSVLDLIVLIFSLFTWNVQIWGGFRTRIVSVKEKSLKSPVFDDFFKKLKQISLKKDEDDELLEKSSLKKALRHQFISDSKYKETIPSHKQQGWIKLPADCIPHEVQMQKSSSFGTEVYEAINAFGSESSQSKEDLKLNVIKFL